MVGATRAVGAVAELVGAALLLGAVRAVDGRVRTGAFGAGFAAGYCYRHARAITGCRTFRRGPGRSVGIALAWTALGVAVDRSVEDPAATRAFAAGVGVGSSGYWLIRGEE